MFSAGRTACCPDQAYRLAASRVYTWPRFDRWMMGAVLAAELLALEELSSEREDRPLFSNLSFSLSAGDILQVSGANGSGKTTLLRIVAGLSSRYLGQLLWRGQLLHKCRDDFRTSCLYLGHGSGNKAVLSPLENLRWSCALRGVACSEEVLLRALAKVGLAGFEYQACHSLSAGQQRRASLARLFCQSAALWILDEPFTAIDQGGVLEMESWIEDFAAQGGAVLLTTHHRLQISGGHRVIALGEGP